MERPSMQRLRLLAEIISTERSYINDMTAFLEVLVKPLAARWNPDVMPEASAVFVKLEKDTSTVLTVARQLLAELEEADAAGQFAETVGDIFMTWSPFLRSLRDFVTAQPRVSEEFTSLSKGNNRKFKSIEATLLSKKESLDRLRGLDFNSFLIMPIQRVPRYDLLLSNLLKETPQTDPSYPQLSSAVASIKRTATHLNASMSRKEAQDALMTIQRSLSLNSASVSSPTASADLEVVGPSRVFLAEGDFLLSLRTLAADFDVLALKTAGLHPYPDTLQRFVTEAVASTGPSGPITAIPLHLFLFNDTLLVALQKGDPGTVLQRVVSGTNTPCVVDPSKQPRPPVGGAAATTTAPPPAYELFCRIPITPALAIELQGSGSGEGWSVAALTIRTTATKLAFRAAASPNVDGELWSKELKKCAEVAAARVFTTTGTLNTAAASGGATAVKRRSARQQPQAAAAGLNRQTSFSSAPSFGSSPSDGEVTTTSMTTFLEGGTTAVGSDDANNGFSSSTEGATRPSSIGGSTYKTHGSSRGTTVSTGTTSTGFFLKGLSSSARSTIVPPGVARTNRKRSVVILPSVLLTGGAKASEMAPFADAATLDWELQALRGLVTPSDEEAAGSAGAGGNDDAATGGSGASSNSLLNRASQASVGAVLRGAGGGDSSIAPAARSVSLSVASTASTGAGAGLTSPAGTASATADIIILRGLLEKQRPGLITSWNSRFFVLRLGKVDFSDPYLYGNPAAANAAANTVAGSGGKSGLTPQSAQQQQQFDFYGDEDDPLSGNNSKNGSGFNTASGGPGRGPAGSLPPMERVNALRGIVEYYKDQSTFNNAAASSSSASSSGPAGVILLSQISAVAWLGSVPTYTSSDRLRRVDILTLSGRRYCLRAPTEADAKQWVKTLAIAMQLRDSMQRELAEAEIQRAERLAEEKAEAEAQQAALYSEAEANRRPLSSSGSMIGLSLPEEDEEDEDGEEGEEGQEGGEGGKKKKGRRGSKAKSANATESGEENYSDGDDDGDDDDGSEGGSEGAAGSGAEGSGAETGADGSGAGADASGAAGGKGGKRRSTRMANANKGGAGSGGGVGAGSNPVKKWVVRTPQALASGSGPADAGGGADGGGKDRGQVDSSALGTASELIRRMREMESTRAAAAAAAGGGDGAVGALALPTGLQPKPGPIGTSRIAGGAGRKSAAARRRSRASAAAAAASGPSAVGVLAGVREENGRAASGLGEDEDDEEDDEGDEGDDDEEEEEGIGLDDEGAGAGSSSSVLSGGADDSISSAEALEAISGAFSSGAGDGTSRGSVVHPALQAPPPPPPRPQSRQYQPQTAYGGQHQQHQLSLLPYFMHPSLAAFDPANASAASSSSSSNAAAPQTAAIKDASSGSSTLQYLKGHNISRSSAITALPAQSDAQAQVQSQSQSQAPFLWLGLAGLSSAVLSATSAGGLALDQPHHNQQQQHQQIDRSASLVSSSLTGVEGGGGGDGTIIHSLLPSSTLVVCSAPTQEDEDVALSALEAAGDAAFDGAAPPTTPASKALVARALHLAEIVLSGCVTAGLPQHAVAFLSRFSSTCASIERRTGLSIRASPFMHSCVVAAHASAGQPVGAVDYANQVMQQQNAVIIAAAGPMSAGSAEAAATSRHAQAVVASVRLAALHALATAGLLSHVRAALAAETLNATNALASAASAAAAANGESGASGTPAASFKLQLSPYHYDCLVTAAAASGDIHRCESVLLSLLKAKAPLPPRSFNTLLRLYASQGNVAAATALGRVLLEGSLAKMDRHLTANANGAGAWRHNSGPVGAALFSSLIGWEKSSAAWLSLAHTIAQQQFSSGIHGAGLNSSALPREAKAILTPALGGASISSPRLNSLRKASGKHHLGASGNGAEDQAGSGSSSGIVPGSGAMHRRQSYAVRGLAGFTRTAATLVGGFNGGNGAPHLLTSSSSEHYLPRRASRTSVSLHSLSSSRRARSESSGLAAGGASNITSFEELTTMLGSAPSAALLTHYAPKAQMVSSACASILHEITVSHSQSSSSPSSTASSSSSSSSSSPFYYADVGTLVAAMDAHATVGDGRSAEAGMKLLRALVDASLFLDPSGSKGVDRSPHLPSGAGGSLDFLVEALRVAHPASLPGGPVTIVPGAGLGLAQSAPTSCSVGFQPSVPRAADLALLKARLAAGDGIGAASLVQEVARRKAPNGVVEDSLLVELVRNCGLGAPYPESLGRNGSALGGSIPEEDKEQQQQQQQQMRLLSPNSREALSRAKDKSNNATSGTVTTSLDKARALYKEVLAQYYSGNEQGGMNGSMGASNGSSASTSAMLRAMPVHIAFLETLVKNKAFQEADRLLQSLLALDASYAAAAALPGGPSVVTAASGGAPSAFTAGGLAMSAALSAAASNTNNPHGGGRGASSLGTQFWSSVLLSLSAVPRDAPDNGASFASDRLADLIRRMTQSTTMPSPAVFSAPLLSRSLKRAAPEGAMRGVETLALIERSHLESLAGPLSQLFAGFTGNAAAAASLARVPLPFTHRRGAIGCAYLHASVAAGALPIAQATLETVENGGYESEFVVAANDAAGLFGSANAAGNRRGATASAASATSDSPAAGAGSLVLSTLQSIDPRQFPDHSDLAAAYTAVITALAARGNTSTADRLCREMEGSRSLRLADQDGVIDYQHSPAAAAFLAAQQQQQQLGLSGTTSALLNSYGGGSSSAAAKRASVAALGASRAVGRHMANLGASLLGDDSSSSQDAAAAEAQLESAANAAAASSASARMMDETLANTYKSLMVMYGLQGKVESARGAYESLQRIRAKQKRRMTLAAGTGALLEEDENGDGGGDSEAEAAANAARLGLSRGALLWESLKSNVEKILDGRGGNGGSSGGAASSRNSLMPNGGGLPQSLLLGGSDGRGAEDDDGYTDELGRSLLPSNGKYAARPGVASRSRKASVLGEPGGNNGGRGFLSRVVTRDLFDGDDNGANDGSSGGAGGGVQGLEGVPLDPLEVEMVEFDEQGDELVPVYATLMDGDGEGTGGADGIYQGQRAVIRSASSRRRAILGPSAVAAGADGTVVTSAQVGGGVRRGKGQTGHAGRVGITGRSVPSGAVRAVSPVRAVKLSGFGKDADSDEDGDDVLGPIGTAGRGRGASHSAYLDSDAEGGSGEGGAQEDDVGEPVDAVVDADAAPYNVLIRAYADSGRVDLAVDLLAEMQRDRVAPDTATIVALIHAHATCGLGHRALDVCATAAQVMLNVGLSMEEVQEVMRSSKVVAAQLYALGCEGRVELLVKAWRLYLRGCEDRRRQAAANKAKREAARAKKMALYGVGPTASSSSSSSSSSSLPPLSPAALRAHSSMANLFVNALGMCATYRGVTAASASSSSPSAATVSSSDSKNGNGVNVSASSFSSSSRPLSDAVKPMPGAPYAFESSDAAAASSSFAASAPSTSTTPLGLLDLLSETVIRDLVFQGQETMEAPGVAAALGLGSVGGASGTGMGAGTGTGSQRTGAVPTTSWAEAALLGDAAWRFGGTAIGRAPLPTINAVAKGKKGGSGSDNDVSIGRLVDAATLTTSINADTLVAVALLLRSMGNRAAARVLLSAASHSYLGGASGEHCKLAGTVSNDRRAAAASHNIHQDSDAQVVFLEQTWGANPGAGAGSPAQLDSESFQALVLAFGAHNLTADLRSLMAGVAKAAINDAMQRKSSSSAHNPPPVDGRLAGQLYSSLAGVSHAWFAGLSMRADKVGVTLGSAAMRALGGCLRYYLGGCVPGTFVGRMPMPALAAVADTLGSVDGEVLLMALYPSPTLSLLPAAGLLPSSSPSSSDALIKVPSPLSQEAAAALSTLQSLGKEQGAQGEDDEDEMEAEDALASALAPVSSRRYGALFDALPGSAPFAAAPSSSSPSLSASVLSNMSAANANTTGAAVADSPGDDLLQTSRTAVDLLHAFQRAISSGSAPAVSAVLQAMGQQGSGEWLSQAYSIGGPGLLHIAGAVEEAQAERKRAQIAAATTRRDKAKGDDGTSPGFPYPLSPPSASSSTAASLSQAEGLRRASATMSSSSGNDGGERGRGRARRELSSTEAGDSASSSASNSSSHLAANIRLAFLLASGKLQEALDYFLVTPRHVFSFLEHHEKLSRYQRHAMAASKRDMNRGKASAALYFSLGTTRKWEEEEQARQQAQNEGLNDEDEDDDSDGEDAESSALRMAGQVKGRFRLFPETFTLLVHALAADVLPSGASACGLSLPAVTLFPLDTPFAQSALAKAAIDANANSASAASIPVSSARMYLHLLQRVFLAAAGWGATPRPVDTAAVVEVHGVLGSRSSALMEIDSAASAASSAGANAAAGGGSFALLCAGYLRGLSRAANVSVADCDPVLRRVASFAASATNASTVTNDVALTRGVQSLSARLGVNLHSLFGTQRVATMMLDALSNPLQAPTLSGIPSPLLGAVGPSQQSSAAAAASATMESHSFAATLTPDQLLASPSSAVSYVYARYRLMRLSEQCGDPLVPRAALPRETVSHLVALTRAAAADSLKRRQDVTALLLLGSEDAGIGKATAQNASSFAHEQKMTVPASALVLSTSRQNSDLGSGSDSKSQAPPRPAGFEVFSRDSSNGPDISKSKYHQGTDLAPLSKAASAAAASAAAAKTAEDEKRQATAAVDDLTFALFDGKGLSGLPKDQFNNEINASGEGGILKAALRSQDKEILRRGKLILDARIPLADLPDSTLAKLPEALRTGALPTPDAQELFKKDRWSVVLLPSIAAARLDHLRLILSTGGSAGAGGGAVGSAAILGSHVVDLLSTLASPSPVFELIKLRQQQQQGPLLLLPSALPAVDLSAQQRAAQPASSSPSTATATTAPAPPASSSAKDRYLKSFEGSTVIIPSQNAVVKVLFEERPADQGQGQEQGQGEGKTQRFEKSLQETAADSGSATAAAFALGGTLSPATATAATRRAAEPEADAASSYSLASLRLDPATLLLEDSVRQIHAETAKLELDLQVAEGELCKAEAKLNRSLAADDDMASLYRALLAAPYQTPASAEEASEEGGSSLEGTSRQLLDDLRDTNSLAATGGASHLSLLRGRKSDGRGHRHRQGGNSLLEHAVRHVLMSKSPSPLLLLDSDDGASADLAVGAGAAEHGEALWNGRIPETALKALNSAKVASLNQALSSLRAVEADLVNRIQSPAHSASRQLYVGFTDSVKAMAAAEAALIQRIAEDEQRAVSAEDAVMSQRRLLRVAVGSNALTSNINIALGGSNDDTALLAALGERGTIRSTTVSEAVSELGSSLLSQAVRVLRRARDVERYEQQQQLDHLCAHSESLQQLEREQRASNSGLRALVHSLEATYDALSAELQQSQQEEEELTHEVSALRTRIELARNASDAEIEDKVLLLERVRSRWVRDVELLTRLEQKQAEDLIADAIERGTALGKEDGQRMLEEARALGEAALHTEWARVRTELSSASQEVITDRVKRELNLEERLDEALKAAQEGAVVVSDMKAALQAQEELLKETKLACLRVKDELTSHNSVWAQVRRKINEATDAVIAAEEQQQQQGGRAGADASSISPATIAAVAAASSSSASGGVPASESAEAEALWHLLLEDLQLDLVNDGSVIVEEILDSAALPAVQEEDEALILSALGAAQGRAELNKPAFVGGSCTGVDLRRDGVDVYASSVLAQSGLLSLYEEELQRLAAMPSSTAGTARSQDPSSHGAFASGSNINYQADADAVFGPLSASLEAAVASAQAATATRRTSAAPTQIRRQAQQQHHPHQHQHQHHVNPRLGILATGAGAALGPAVRRGSDASSVATAQDALSSSSSASASGPYSSSLRLGALLPPSGPAAMRRDSLNAEDDGQRQIGSGQARRDDEEDEDDANALADAHSLADESSSSYSQYQQHQVLQADAMAALAFNRASIYAPLRDDLGNDRNPSSSLNDGQVVAAASSPTALLTRRILNANVGGVDKQPFIQNLVGKEVATPKVIQEADSAVASAIGRLNDVLGPVAAAAAAAAGRGGLGDGLGLDVVAGDDGEARLPPLAGSTRSAAAGASSQQALIQQRLFSPHHRVKPTIAGGAGGAGGSRSTAAPNAITTASASSGPQQVRRAGAAGSGGIAMSGSSSSNGKSYLSPTSSSAAKKTSGSASRW